MRSAQDIIEKIRFDEIQFDDNVMDNWSEYGFVKKDIFNGDIFKINGISECKDGKFNVNSENGVTIPCFLKKEKRFFNLNNVEFKDFSELELWINSDLGKGWFLENEVYVSVSVDSSNILGSLADAYFDNKKTNIINQKDVDRVYYAKIKERNGGGFLVDIDGIDAFLPGSLAAANIVTNFDELIGKEIPVMFEDYLKEGDTFIVSNKKYIKHILPKKIKELDLNKEYTGQVTGSKNFGIFVEFDDILTGLLHTSEMYDETLDKFKNSQFRSGDDIKFYIKEVTRDNRIIMTEKFNVEKVSIDDFAKEYENTVIEGFVTAVKTVGVFVRFTHKENSFTGLLHKNNIPQIAEFTVGENTNFYISKVDCETNKIFLKMPFK